MNTSQTESERVWIDCFGQELEVDDAVMVHDRWGTWLGRVKAFVPEVGKVAIEDFDDAVFHRLPSKLEKQ